MNWTLDQLEAFIYAVKYGSFSAAARKLGKAQSRISTAIANLEADLGVELFDRSGRFPILTPTGEEMHSEAQAVFAQCQRLQSRAETVCSGEELSLTVAMDEAVPVTTFEYFFELTANQYPLLKLTIISGSQQDIARWVDQGKADVGICFHQHELPNSLEFLTIGEFSQSLIVAPKHALAKVPQPSYAQLNQHRQLVIRDRVGEKRASPLSVKHWYVDSYYMITAMVIRGVGWALVPEHLVNEQWCRDEVVDLSSRNIAGTLLIEMGLVKRRDKGKGPVMHWMYDTVAQMFAQKNSLKK